MSCPLPIGYPIAARFESTLRLVALQFAVVREPTVRSQRNPS